MSTEVTVPAYATQLGNCPAKMVLVLLADQANADGYGWPSIRTIVQRTELAERTVQRTIQVLQDIGLVEKIKTPDKVYPYAFQINLRLLGKDLRKEFQQKYEEAQKPSVSQTPVSQTEKGVSQTEPPHPLIGVTVIEPLPLEEIYQAYPRHVGKLEALKAIEKALKRIDAATLLQRVKAYANLPAIVAKRKSSTDKEFIPHPATWFNRGSYYDEDLQPKAPTPESKARAEYDAKVENFMAEMEKFQ